MSQRELITSLWIFSAVLTCMEIGKVKGIYGFNPYVFIYAHNFYNTKYKQFTTLTFGPNIRFRLWLLWIYFYLFIFNSSIISPQIHWFLGPKTSQRIQMKQVLDFQSFAHTDGDLGMRDCGGSFLFKSGYHAQICLGCEKTVPFISCFENTRKKTEDKRGSVVQPQIY